MSCKQSYNVMGTSSRLQVVNFRDLRFTQIARHCMKLLGAKANVLNLKPIRKIKSLFVLGPKGIKFLYISNGNMHF